VGFFRRREPLHERLAREAGMTTAPSLDPRPPLLETGVHGLQRARTWDTTVSADAPDIEGDEVRFVALPDGVVLSEQDESDEALAELAARVTNRLAPPYRAEAVRRGPEQWAVAASRIATVRVPGLHGDEAELVSTREGRVLSVDGTPRFGSAPALERVGEPEGGEYVVRARRLEGDLWEVEASPL
jgi:hypothetical protein